jgi:hypothetical protein
MKASDLRFALCNCLAAAALGACSISQPPIGSTGAILQGPGFAAHAERGKSWMLPEAKGDALLYVSDGKPGVVVFSYPGDKVTGTLAVPAAKGLCTDSAGDVFITIAQGEGGLDEYAHGGTEPIQSLIDNGDGLPYGCSVDPVTGNLAVANHSSDGGNVAVWTDATGQPRFYSGSASERYFYCGYDNAGNLFVDGETYVTQNVVFGEIPKGGSEISPIALDMGLSAPGEVQWDGKHMTIADPGQGELFRITVSGSKAKVVGTTVLDGYGEPAAQSWIQGDRLMAQDGQGGGRLGFWRYPEGVLPQRVLRKGLNPKGAILPGVTVSVPAGGQGL